MPTKQPTDLDVSRFPQAGALTISASVAAVQIIRALAVVILHPLPGFQPLTLFPPILDTVLGVAGAIFVFYQIGQYAQDPISTFRKVAAGVLLLSFAPDVALADLLCSHPRSLYCICWLSRL